MRATSLLLLGFFGVVLLTPSTASGTVITYVTVLNGANEIPPNGSSATGTATLTLNGDTLTVNEVFAGLIGGSATAAHIHCCAPLGTNAGVAVPLVSFPSATSGTYVQSFDLTLLATYNGTFVTNNGGTAASAEAALIAGLNAGQAYVNIHDATYPGGEIRGQLQAVPEPATWSLLSLSALALLILGRKRSIGA